MIMLKTLGAAAQNSVAWDLFNPVVYHPSMYYTLQTYHLVNKYVPVKLALTSKNKFTFSYFQLFYIYTHTHTHTHVTIMLPFPGMFYMPILSGAAMHRSLYSQWNENTVF